MHYIRAMRSYIEVAINADADDLSQLINGAYRGESSKVGWTTEADLLDGTRTDAAAIAVLLETPGTTLLKYVENDAIVGCVELRIDAGKLYLGMLTVRPDLQGRGLGRKLVNRAEQVAIANDCNSIYMTVLSARDELIEWYERQGYKATGERKPFAFNDARFGQPKVPLEFVVLEKDISES